MSDKTRKIIIRAIALFLAALMILGGVSVIANFF